MMPTLEYLLLILIVREISCYDTSLPDFDAMREDILKAKARHRVKRVSCSMPSGEENMERCRIGTLMSSCMNFEIYDLLKSNLCGRGSLENEMHVPE